MGRAEVTIETKHGSEAEARTRELLLGLFEELDLGRYTFTTRVRVDERATPHSHPVLTMSTRFMVRTRDGALADYLHEQLHWWVAGHRRATRQANAKWRQEFGKVPRGAEGGAKTRRSTLLHLTVNWLEHTALVDVIGEARARSVIEAKASGDIYPWVYQQVLDRNAEIGSEIRRVGLDLAD